MSALLELAEGLAALPGAALDVGRPTAWLLVLTYGLPLAIFLWPRSRRRRRSNTRRVDAPAWPLRRRNLRWAAAGVLALAWLGWMLRPLPLPRGAIGLYVLDVGNGSANLLVDASRTGHVVDAGSQRNMDVARTVEFALDEWRVRRVASVVISHSNLDHYSAVAPLLARHPQAALFVNPFYEAVAAENGYLSLPEDLRAAGWTGAPQPLAAGAALDFGGHAVEVLWPPADATIRSTNDQSLVLRIHANRRTILIPGDIERDALEALLVQVDAQSLDLTADILIAPHHGAVIDPFTELFLEAVQPEVVLVSTQREQVRLAPLVHRVMGPRCAVYMTRTHGALALTIDPAGVIRVELPFSARAPDE